MKGMLVVPLTLCLAGCATYSEMQQQPPYVTRHTAKAPQAFSDCALPLLVDKQADVHAIKDGSSVALIVPIGNRGADLAATVTASPTDAGSDVAVRSISSRSATKVMATVAPCL